MDPDIHARRLAAVVGGVLVAALAACGTSSTPSSTVTVTATPTAGGTPSGGGPAAPSTTPPTSPPAQAGPAECATRQLTVSVGNGGAAAGTAYYHLDFTNSSSRACFLEGYPGVSFVTGQGGSQIGAAADRNPVFARHAITLAPGAVAHALLGIGTAANYSPSLCGSIVNTRWLKVFPPDQFTALYVPLSSQACSKRSTVTIHVSVIVAHS
jgi:Protein of unknown function (DUF4232)